MGFFIVIDKIMIVAHPDDEALFGGAELLSHPEKFKLSKRPDHIPAWDSLSAKERQWESDLLKKNIGTWHFLTLPF